MAKIHNGDEIAWREFYDRYAPVIRYIGVLYRLNPSECDDLVQNVMLKFFDAEKSSSGMKDAASSALGFLP